MARNIALIAGSLTAAAVLALGLAAAGFGPTSDPNDRSVAAASVVAQAGDADVASSLLAGPTIDSMSVDEVVAALHVAGIAADGPVIVVQPDGTVLEIHSTADAPPSGMDELMRRLERRLAGTDDV